MMKLNQLLHELLVMDGLNQRQFDGLLEGLRRLRAELALIGRGDRAEYTLVSNKAL
jgi:hypothetical protein